MAKNNPPQPDPGSGDGLSKAQRRAQRAAQASAELAARRRRAQVRRVALIVGGVVALAAIFTVLVWTGTKSGSGDSTATATGAPAAGDTQYGLAIGDKDAPHTLVIYEDFICPYCGQFEAASHEGIAAAAAAGKVYVDYRPFHLLPEDYSAQALNAFAAVKDIVGDVAAKKLHDYLYAHQPSETGPYPSVDDLVTDANQYVPAAQQQKVDDAIRNSSYQSYVDGATDLAENQAGVTGTPTILLDGNRFNQGNSWSDIGTNLVAALNK